MTAPDGYFEHDISDEQYREVVEQRADGTVTTYRIDNPKTLIIRKGGSTHKVIDDEGIVHMYLFQPGTIVRWKPRNPAKPVKF